MLQTFPRYLVRYTPRAVTELDCLRSERLERLAHELDLRRVEADRARERLEDELYRRIGSLPRGPERFELLAVRRRVHQRKKLRANEQALIAAHSAVAAAWREYQAATRRSEETEKLFCDTYDADLRKAVSDMRRLAEVPTTAAALALASPTLFEALLAVRDPGQRRGVDKVDGSLARYVYRACTKTSPFSTLTVVSEGRLRRVDGTESPGRLILREDGAEVRNVSMTGFLQEAIWEHASLSPRLRDQMPCSMNPTISSDAQAVSWYTTIGNQEVIRRMRPPQWLGAFTHRLIERRTVSVREARELLTAVSPLEPPAAEETILQLLRAGLLISDPPASSLDDDWPRLTRSWFQALARSEPEAAPIAGLLATLEDIASRLPHATPVERIELITAAERDVVRVLGGTRIPRFYERPPRPGDRRTPTVGKRGNGRLSREALFYEDVKGALTLDLSAPEVGALCESLDELARRSVLLNPSVTARKGLALLVERRFGRDARIPFMEVFKQVQAHRLEAVASDEDGDEDRWEYPEAREVLAEQTRRAAAWFEAVADAAERSGGFQDPASIQLSLADVQAGEQHLEGWIDAPRARSRAATVQVGRRDDGSTYWVMHAPVITEGLGRTFSRFLPVLPREFTEELREWNARLPFGADLVENVDGSRFNGNAHPWLVPAEIAVPNGNYRRVGPGTVPIADLDVRLHEGRIELVERGTDRVRIPCHLGFQNRGRSAAFELLSAFSPDGSVYLYALLEKLNARWRSIHGREEDDTAPRITFERDLVLQRRRWSLPLGLVQRARELPPGEWFRELNRWRRAEQLPGRAFYRVPVRKGDTHRKHRKPQFLAFNDPLGCELLRAVAATAGREVRMEEVLPTAEQMPSGPRGQHSIEVTVCWYVQ